MPSPATTPPAVAADRVSKRFELPREQVHTLKERALHPFRGSQVDVLQALRDVSFQVEPGEFFGIVGRNGSGKSTLLKCLAGIYATDVGALHVNGNLSAFIELGVGFNMDLAARDNVLLNATLLGLSPREARRRYDSIIDFAELGEFTDLKIKNYSTGMLVRLAFAVMIQVDADILLIDEVLAVGDASFQQKCFDEFERIHRAGKTVLLVTHDMNSVTRFCQRAMLLEKGRVVAIGDPEAVGSKYLELNFSAEARAAEAGQTGAPRVLPRSDAPSRFGDGTGEIVGAWFMDANEHHAEALPVNHHAHFAAEVLFHDRVEHPRFTLSLQNSHHDAVWTAGTEWRDPETGIYEAGDRVQFRLYFPNYLAPDRYTATVTVEHPGGAWIDRRERMLTVMVTGTAQTGALVQTPYDAGVHRVYAPAAHLEAT